MIKGRERETKITRFVPSRHDACVLCRAHERLEVPDLVGLRLGALHLVICSVHAYQLVEQLLDRYYPVWGDGPLFEKLAQEKEESDGAKGG